MSGERNDSQPGVLASLVSCVSYIGISATLINYNKSLISIFPHAMELATCHMLSSVLFCLLLFKVMPGWFPAMKHLEGRRSEVLRYFIPIGLCFAVSLYCGTRAFLYCSVAFLQFMKEGNIALVFFLSCAAGLQTMGRVKMAVVMWIIAGSALCVRGEVNFVLVGFALQLCAQVAESMKNVAGEFVLSASDLKLDPLTYVMFMSPIALGFLSVGCVVTWNPAVVEAFQRSWHLILPSCALAVGLNVAVASVLQNCSTMGFTVAGLVKDIIIVVVSSYIYDDVITQLQFLGFAVTLSGCAAWANIKMRPEGSTMAALGLLLGATADRKLQDLDENEKAPLLSDVKGTSSPTTNV